VRRLFVHVCVQSSRACMFLLYEMLMDNFYDMWMYLVPLMDVI
jgi:hypothetical protein